MVVHNLNFLLGTEAITNSVATQGGSDRNFVTQIPSLEYLGNGADVNAQKTFQSLSAMVAFFPFRKCQLQLQKSLLCDV